MKTETILKKALTKAWKEGWDRDKRCWEGGGTEDLLNFNEYYALIFSHDFAKAFFGEELVEEDFYEAVPYDEGYEKLRLPAWKYHLQQMVLEKEPLKYLSKFL